MTAIVELPTEPKFTIKAVASQTGISPVTLRAWERRHEVLTPHRQENHYRLYSERDIAILRWLKNQVDEGMPIGSAINELRRMTRSNIWPEAYPSISSRSTEQQVLSGAQYVSQLSQAILRHDENKASNLLREIHSRLDILKSISEVIAPTASQIKEAWYQGEIDPTAKRFATMYLRDKLVLLLQAYPSRSNAPLILIGCAPMEVNELPSLMMAVLLRSQGYRVDYLGADINIEDLADYSSYELPALVILWADSEFTAREMRPMQRMLKNGRNTPLFGYAGSAFSQKPQLREEIPGTYLSDGFEETLNQINNLLGSPQKNKKSHH